MPQIFLADGINLWDLLAVPTLVEVPPNHPQDFCWNRDPNTRAAEDAGAGKSKCVGTKQLVCVVLSEPYL